MKWKLPPAIKIYEALGAVADGRVEVDDKDNEGVVSARVFSSSRNKFYMVFWDEMKQAIMTNDNGTYWQGYLGYPGLAFLMKIGELEYRKEVAQSLEGIAWKDLNTRFNNRFEKTMEVVWNQTKTNGVTREELEDEVERITERLKQMKLVFLGKKLKPPKGY